MNSLCFSYDILGTLIKVNLLKKLLFTKGKTVNNNKNNKQKAFVKFDLHNLSYTTQQLINTAIFSMLTYLFIMDELSL